jgi:unsaturated rhamnogalacturonyl hydrolase
MRALALLFVASLAPSWAQASDEEGRGLLTPESVLQAMERVASWQLAQPPRHPSTDWTNGALDAGMMALARISADARYEDALLAMGRANGWQLGPREYHGDDHCVGQTYAELYVRHRDPAMLGPLGARFDFIMAHPKSDDLTWGRPDSTDRWSWCDALFMAPPAWTRLYVATGERKYLDFMNRLWWVTSDFLYDKDEHLYFRDASYFALREANGRKVFWSRGNGWVMAGLARVMEHLPRDYSARTRYEQQYREMAAKIRTLQQADGLWRSSLLDPESYPLKETSGSGFYCFALTWGVNRGLLERETFEPVVRRAWAALVASIRPDGKLGDVQPIGADPKAFDPEHSDVYGVGAFLLAGSEIYRLALLGDSPRVRVRVANEEARFRVGEVARIDWKRLSKAAPWVSQELPAVVDDHGATLAAVEVTQKRGRPDALVFSVDLAPRQQHVFEIVRPTRDLKRLAVPPRGSLTAMPATLRAEIETRP